MKAIVALFVLMIVANLAFLAWGYWMSRQSRGGKGGGGKGTCVSCGLSCCKKGRGRHTGTAPVKASGCSCSSSPSFNEGLPEPGRQYFMILPYLQLGSGAQDQLELHWAVPLRQEGQWSVEVEPTVRVHEILMRPVCVEQVERHNRYSVQVSGLVPGETYKYRVLRNGTVVFDSQFSGPKTGAQHRFVVVGDMGNGSVEAGHVAYEIWRQKADLIAITGDVVYHRGTVNEYLARYFPFYNLDKPGPETGAPILRSVPTFTSLGNHCVGKMEWNKSSSFDEHPGLLAYFHYWSLPLNGPTSIADDKNVPDQRGGEAAIGRFRCTAGERFPVMANYSFDYGNVHWLVLDANAYMDWSDAKLRAWVEADLQSSNATWKLVNFHQPGFTSNLKHGQETRMRLLSDIFERYGVNVVFNGHAHFYERTCPIKFLADPAPVANAPLAAEREVTGQFTLDKEYDGKTKTRPDGVIYIVTGGGGARLDPNGTQWREQLWQPFTVRIIGDRHSFTVCDVDGDTLTVKQLAMSGHEIDRFVITK